MTIILIVKIHITCGFVNCIKQSVFEMLKGVKMESTNVDAASNYDYDYDNSDEQDDLYTTVICQVTRFNPKYGYGFVKILTPKKHLPSTLFVHQTELNVSSDCFR